MMTDWDTTPGQRAKVSAGIILTECLLLQVDHLIDFEVGGVRRRGTLAAAGSDLGVRPFGRGVADDRPLRVDGLADFPIPCCGVIGAPALKLPTRPS
jgi:hypothetical protein